MLSEVNNQHKRLLVQPRPVSTGNHGMATAFASAPEQGQLVSVRSRNWIVNEVVPSALPTTGLQGISDPQTLISLASVGIVVGRRVRRSRSPPAWHHPRSL